MRECSCPCAVRCLQGGENLSACVRALRSSRLFSLLLMRSTSCAPGPEVCWIVSCWPRCWMCSSRPGGCCCSPRCWTSGGTLSPGNDASPVFYRPFIHFPLPIDLNELANKEAGSCLVHLSMHQSCSIINNQLIYQKKFNLHLFSVRQLTALVHFKQKEKEYFLVPEETACNLINCL